ncbi:hypothetical protein LOK49_LG08G02326 [Camellia lanceoleosa]|uniref:Uncharacterized protein n=1 Tax=Camellia lanceoleosa TaxID=1840588 RepID=A0ACC0GV49_9ERIC|nr:hypothetical protein LOK49_LG08G02326 [Camellia lanceoleosa]
MGLTRKADRYGTLTGSCKGETGHSDVAQRAICHPLLPTGHSGVADSRSFLASRFGTHALRLLQVLQSIFTSFVWAGRG